MSKEKPRKRIKIKGHYMQVRQRSTKKGKKGTMMAKWKSEKREKKRVYRCKLPLISRLQMMTCGHKKAGSHCLKAGDRGNKCQKLKIAYH
jgi:hypothetical protein